MERFWWCHQLSWTKCVNRKLSIILFMIKESGANHLPPESSMDLFISLCIRITDGVFFFSVIWLSIHSFKDFPIFLHHRTWPLRHNVWGNVSSSLCRFFHFISCHNWNHVTRNKLKLKQSTLSVHLSGSIVASKVSPWVLAFSYFHFAARFDNIGEKWEKNSSMAVQTKGAGEKNWPRSWQISEYSGFNGFMKSKFNTGGVGRVAF